VYYGRCAIGEWGTSSAVFQTANTTYLHYYTIPKDPEAPGMYSSVTIALRASLTGGLLLSTMCFSVPPNDPYSPCDHQSYLFPSFRT